MCYSGGSGNGGNIKEYEKLDIYQSLEDRLKRSICLDFSLRIVLKSNV